MIIIYLKILLYDILMKAKRGKGMNKKKNYLLLCFNYFLIFFSNALFLSFFQIFLLSKGFNESKIGIISSITPLLCIIVNPLYSIIGKNNKRIRYLLLVLCLLEALVILLVYKVEQFNYLIIVMCLVAMVDPPLFVILDSYASGFVKENNYNYSYIRIVGTISFAIGTFVCGLLVENIGYNIVFIIASILMMISFLITLLLKTNKVNEEKEKNDIILLLKNKTFLIFAIYYVFILAFASLGDTYISIYLTNEKNIDESTYGLINSLWVIIELLCVLLLNKLKIKNDKLLFIIMGLSYLIRILIIGIDASTNISIIGALFRGIGMGITIYLYIPFISKIVKPSNVSTALLFISMVKSLLSTIFIFVSGFLVENYSYSFTFIIWSVLMMIIIIGYYFIERKNKTLFIK